MEMTKNELKFYEQLNEIFVKSCEHVTEIMKRADPDWDYAIDFLLDEGEVYCTINKYYDCNTDDSYSRTFPADYLTMTDEELNAIVNKQIAEKKKKELAKLDAERKAKEELYERLKEELGK